ncbi:ribosomal RNA small subunit methyltransferase D [Halalkalibacter wakoensis JCM 9140]|uniref:Ribosomal RNA small subunit methyltransferase D n=1 Tax=Halalkalibacter wakoensis JCM 9140 TaxID=1236970 RepID=W4PWK7_9BACI|nr:ribosomal RNA small subunit methyltransferase D [Halalkalibacter wakoensis JCM 9140]
MYRNDANRALKALIKREIAFSLIFLDPPYAKQNIVNEMGIMFDHQLVTDTGVIVCEHTSSIELPEQIGVGTKLRSETYGETTITIFQKGKEVES